LSKPNYLDILLIGIIWNLGIAEWQLIHIYAGVLYLRKEAKGMPIVLSLSLSQEVSHPF